MAARVLSNSVKKTQVRHEQSKLKEFFTKSKEIQNRDKYKEQSKINIISVSGIGLAALVGFIHRKQISLMEDWFGTLEKQCQASKYRIKGVETISIIVANNILQATSYGLSRIKEKHKMSGPRFNDSFMEVLKGLIHVDKFLESRAMGSKRYFIAQLKHVTPQTSPVRAKNLVKTQSLVLASSENVFFGLQAMTRLLHRTISGSFK